MLATRIIPVVLFRGSQLVKGEKFNSWRSVGHAAQAGRIYAARGCDEIILLDIGATPEGRGPDLEMVRAWTDDNFCPITVGGGVRSAQDVRRLLNAGADKVSIGAGFNEVEGLLQDIASTFGSQAVSFSLDVRNGTFWTRGGTHDTRLNAVTAARSAEGLGAGEILLTSIDREGTLIGYDLDLIEAVSSAVSIPVIANGGCGSYEHMKQAIDAGADAVAAGAFFQFTEATPKGAAEYLAKCNVEVRL
ncbi:MAG: imidazole glycerol phosphate synthase subunit HisF [Bellilinea sp.]